MQHQQHRIDTTVMKVDSSRSPRGEQGQIYLASGVHVSMRLWEDIQPHEKDAPHTRPYETVGYVIRGKALLHLGDQVVTLEEGDSWVVPSDSMHSYEVLEPFTAVEATCPPAYMHGRDEH